MNIKAFCALRTLYAVLAVLYGKLDYCLAMLAPAKAGASDITDSVEEQLEPHLNAVVNFQKHLIFAPSLIIIP